MAKKSLHLTHNRRFTSSKIASPPPSTSKRTMFTLASIGVPSQRQRSRKACQPCRQRKRKCDGRVPCQTCVRYDYDCFYSASERTSSGAHFVPKPGHPYGVYQHPGTPPPSVGASPDMKDEGHPGVLDPDRSRFDGAKSAVPCPGLLGLSFGSSNAPRLHSFAWNLGVRPEPRIDEADFTQYLAFSDLERLAEVYFLVIHPIFNFIDRDVFKDLCRLRYSQKNQKHDIDPIICGVAALGSLYAIGTKQSSHCHEAELVELAKTSLEHSSIVSSPTQHHVTAWILRTIYLRSTSPPHASWISSCTTMHIVEATGLHRDVSSISAASSPSPSSSSSATPEINPADSETRRRLFWVAWSLNKVLSYEHGRNPVPLPHSTIPPLEPDDSDGSLNTSQYIALATLLPSDSSDLNEPPSAHTLYASLNLIAALPSPSPHHALTLLTASLSFTLYLNLRLSPSTTTPLSNLAGTLVTKIGLAALPSASNLAAQHLPWWPVLSVPFQLLCILLAIDSRESLSHVKDAMRALQEVGRCWDTHVVREAVGRAGLLVGLSRRRKEEDVGFLRLAKAFSTTLTDDGTNHHDVERTMMPNNQRTVAGTGSDDDVKIFCSSGGGSDADPSFVGGGGAGAGGELTPTPSPISDDHDSQNSSSVMSGTDTATTATAMLESHHDDVVSWADDGDSIIVDPQQQQQQQHTGAATVVDWNTFLNTFDWI